ncbi:specifically androgen-regulated gene protein [Protopterus annectens]|uniref:specifically androgen-regulated gene protein n=1 Tax=Protopterus annectens TaxID=7888 RepID=UPI001CFB16BE|nr:specifically androgen-regulated gene protein [Protopterus annectens]XP_043932391.1 specifically androgen-regulated gene protein [Protopterus annectens]
MPEKGSSSDCVAMNSMLRTSSLGSCDSVVSTNSAFSDDSYDYLSAEEKECLIFLEETIESLDTEADSGVSTDENDRVEDSVVKSSVSAQQSPPAKTVPRGDSVQNHEKPASDVCNPVNHISGAFVHPAHVPANRRSITLPKSESKTLSPTFEQKVLSHKLEQTALSPKFEQKVLSPPLEQTSSKYEQKTLPPKLERTSSPQKAPATQLGQTNLSPKIGQKNVEAAKIMVPQQIAVPTTNVSRAYSEPHKATSKGENAKLQVPVQLPEKSSTHDKFVPPPEPFKDQHNLHKVADSSVSKTGSLNVDMVLFPVHAGKILKTDNVSGLTPGNLELLKQQAAQKRVPLEPPGQTDKPVGKADMVSLNSSENSLHVEKSSHIIHSSIPPVGETADQKMKPGPPTAPKPKKLPNNIILKQGYQPPPPSTLEALEGVRLSAPAVVLHADIGPFRSSGSFTDRPLLKKTTISDQQQARQEALKKLGLIKNASIGTSVNSCTPKEDKSESANLAKPLTPDPAITKKSEISVDRTKSASQFNLVHRSVTDVVDSSLATGGHPFKSFSLERSGPSLSSYIANNKHLETGLEKSRSRNSFVENLSPSFLRSNRQRTVSLGTKSDFTNLSVPPEESTGREMTDLRRSLPSQISTRKLSKHGADLDPEPLDSLNHLKRTSIKKQEMPTTRTEVVDSVSHNPFPPHISTNRLTKAPGTRQSSPRESPHSVQIAPRNSTNEHRTEALKKLGLLKEGKK